MTEIDRMKQQEAVEAMLPDLKAFGFMTAYLVPWIVVAAMAI